MNGWGNTVSLAWITQTLIGFSLLIVLVLLVRKPVARRFGAGAAYALWLLPLIRLVLPPVAIPHSWTAWLKSQAPAEPIAAQAEPVLAAVPAIAADLPFIAATPAPSVISSISPAEIILSLLTIWTVIALALFARILLQHRGFVRVLDNDHEPVSPSLQHRAQGIAARIGLNASPRLIASLVVSSPLVLRSGAQNHCIVPAWFETDFTPAEQDAALAHEFMHVKRGDLIALKVCALTTSAFWFNPLVWIGARAFRVDQEAACDADVLRRTSISPHTYGATLLKAVRGGRFGAAPLAASLPLTHALKERLTRMKNGPVPMKFRTLWLGLAGVAGLGVAVATASVTASAHESQNVRLQNETLYIDGKKVENRRFKLLGDPLSDVVPPMPVMPAMPAMPSMAPMPPMPPEAPSPAGLAGGNGADETTWIHDTDYTVSFSNEFDAEMAELSAAISKDGARISRVAMALAAAEIRGNSVKAEALQRELDALEDSIETKAAALELHAEAYESRMDAWATQFEASMEAQSEALEAHMDAQTEALEAQMDAETARIEAQMDADTARFETRIEDRARVVHELAEACRDAELKSGEKRTVRATSDDGKTFEADCEDTQNQ